VDELTPTNRELANNLRLTADGMERLARYYGANVVEILSSSRRSARMTKFRARRAAHFGHIAMDKRHQAEELEAMAAQREARP
jgi:hypothetical protein